MKAAASKKSLEESSTKARRIFGPYLREVMGKVANNIIDLNGEEIKNKGLIKKIKVKKMPGRSGITENGRLFYVSFLDQKNEEIADAEITVDVSTWGLDSKKYDY